MVPADEVRQTATTAEQVAAKRAALLDERECYIARGLDDRVAAVDHELDRLADPAEVAAAEAAPAIAKAETRPGKATAGRKRATKRG